MSGSHSTDPQPDSPPPPPAVPTPHDRFFKALMERPGAADALLRERLPPAVTARLADDPPEPVPGSFIDPELAEHRTDRLYRLRTRDGGAVFVYTLVEHKSEVDPRVALQLLRYLTRIWEALDREAGGTGPLPPIVPLVVYHGVRPWTAPRRFADMVAADGDLRPHLLDFPFGVVDLGQVPDGALSAVTVLRVGLMLLKHALRGTEPRLVLDAAALALLRADAEFFGMALRYMLSTPMVPDRAAALAVVRQVRPDDEEAIMQSYADTLLREGAARGEAKGRAEGEAKGKAEGKAEGKADLLLRLLARRFGPVPEARRAQLAAATPEQLDAWGEALLDAETLDAVFTTTAH